MRTPPPASWSVWQPTNSRLHKIAKTNNIFTIFFITNPYHKPINHCIVNSLQSQKPYSFTFSKIAIHNIIRKIEADKKCPSKEIEGSFEEPANILAMWLGKNSALYDEVYAQIAQGQWLADITPEACAAILQDTG